jgi:hypothetical protein
VLSDQGLSPAFRLRDRAEASAWWSRDLLRQ